MSGSRAVVQAVVTFDVCLLLYACAHVEALHHGDGRRICDRKFILRVRLLRARLVFRFACLDLDSARVRCARRSKLLALCSPWASCARARQRTRMRTPC